MEDLKSKLQNVYDLQKRLNEACISTPDDLQELITFLERKYITEVAIPSLEKYSTELLKCLNCNVGIGIIKANDGEVHIYNQDDFENEDFEFEENDEFQNDTLRSDMKNEAIVRMNAIGLYDYVIKSFAKGGEVYVYEPPMGACYSLEEEEQNMVSTTESRYNILIWGVIKCFMKYNRKDVDVYCMLYVGHDKDDWNSERENLYSGIPHVFTYMPEYDLSDSGSINIYMSEGGTPLRRFV